ncbi:MAG: cobalamin-dependent protein [Deltaproteobacteria bacterium]|nr:cobalamin-dependent protein [Deltaproteobacteria bacterium]
MSRGKIIVAKLGLDGHTNGIRIVSKWLQDAGFEVVYMGLYNTPEKVIKAMLQEDADILGLSFLEGSHMYYAEKLRELAIRYGIEGRKIVFGGVIPPDDVEKLKALGISEVFLPGTSKEKIISTIRTLLGG